MKFSFKKIAAVLAGAVMLGSTIGFAALYPAPFVQNGQADVAVVYGSTAADTDLTAATSIANDLATGVTTTSATVGAGEKVLIQKGSTKFQIGANATDVWGAGAITKSDLPTLLADGTFSSTQNDFDYTQTIRLGNNLVLTHFVDSDYKANVPVLGMKIDSSKEILNYTLDFTTNVESTLSTAGRLQNIESKTLPLLGKNYYILTAENGTTRNVSAGTSDTKLTLLDSANEATVGEGTPATVSVGSKTYTVEITGIGTSTSGDWVMLKVNGESTDKLSESSTKKLSDGSTLGVKSILYTSKESGTSKAIVSIGSGKLEITSGQDIVVNGNAITNLKGIIARTDASGGKEKIDKITINWKLTDKSFVASDKALLMPAFGAVQVIMGGVNFPGEETTQVIADGSDQMTLKAPLKDGDVTLDLLATNTTGAWGNIGGKSDSSEKLKTTSVNNILLNYTNNDKLFIASWASTRDSETHLLYLQSLTKSSTEAKVKIQDKLTGSSYELSNSSAGATATFGNVVLTLNSINYGDTERNVNFSINTGGSFNKLYTKEGLLVYLPWNSVDVTTTPGAINLTALPLTYNLILSEEDKDGNLGAGANITMALTSGGTGSDPKVSINPVTATTWAGTSDPIQIDQTKVYEGYVKSALASKVLWDKGDTSQYSAEVIYHGGESYADVYVAAPSVATGAQAAVLTVKDSEVSSVSTKNLIVVGGSCVNTVAAQVLGVASGTCGDAFTAATGVAANGALIKVAESPLLATKFAMLVAGYDAADTVKAATYVTAEKPSTAVGTTKLSTVGALAVVAA
jgi:hypothetical protein